MLIALTSACSPSAETDALPDELTEEHLLEHIEVLASDEFGGRSPGTEFEEKTLAYIMDRFREYGVEPGMPDGSFLQPVPLMGQATREAAMSLQSGEAASELAFRDEFMAWPAHVQESVNLRDAELIYVGYGIEAPEEEWDDFKDTDVSGKILVFKNFNPTTYQDRFNGGNRLYYGRWTYKYEKAIEKGALGALIIHTNETAGYGWDVVRNSWSLERFFVFNEETYRTEFEGWLTHDQSRRLFEMAGLELDEMLADAENPDFKPVPLSGVQIDVSLAADYRSIEGTNVVGKISGSDPELTDEAVVFSAHHDHLGTGSPVDGDSIFNGAWDNASGVSAVLNLARLFSSEPANLRRSLYFVTVTAEESGLLGSQFFAQNPPVPAGKISANINLDAINVFGSTRDMVAIGYGRTDIDDMLTEEAAKMNRAIKPDQQPEQGFYYRSDHFSFAKQGIPSLYPDQGIEFIDKPEDYNQQVEEYRSHIYHTVHDHVHDWWDLSGAADDLKLIYRASKRIANSDHMRQWVPGDEFEQVRLEAIREAQMTDAQ